MRVLNITLKLLSAVLILAGLLLAAANFYPQALGLSSRSGESPSGQTSAGSPDAKGGAPESSLAPSGVSGASSRASSGGPEDKTLKVTIPGMRRVESDTVPTSGGGDERALKRNVAIHLEGTGYPWQQETNVYLAGHRIGYPGTDSFMGFYDLNRLQAGDKVHVTDSEGERYTYRVFRDKVVAPANTSVTEPVEGKNILTLQTCTLPDYTQRLIVQAERVA
ncbi:MAG: class E sortase [Rubrobacter sp.]|nr:class E sortase [Rubrobacter sp.]